MADNLTRMGAHVTATNNDLIIEGGRCPRCHHRQPQGSPHGHLLRCTPLAAGGSAIQGCGMCQYLLSANLDLRRLTVMSVEAHEGHDLYINALHLVGI